MSQNNAAADYNQEERDKFIISLYGNLLPSQIIHLHFLGWGTVTGMLDETTNMPEYQWKLTIVERNLLLSNWLKLLPEAQEQMLWEVQELIEDLPLLDKQQLLTSLETLQDHTKGDLLQKVQQLLNNQFRFDIREVLELNIQQTTFSNDLETVLVEAIN